jgi:hypothetical protein
MGWGSEDKDHGGIGYKFAHLIKPGDIILIARRYHGQPDLVGVGVVSGRYERFRRGLHTPQDYGSRRRLKPFKPLARVPRNIPILSVLGHIKALRQIHPESNEDQRKVCDWFLSLLSLPQISGDQTQSYSNVDALLKDLHLKNELEYKVQHRKAIATAKRLEARLVLAYQNWLKRQGRVLHIARYGKLNCDAYEKNRNNLIEAKRNPGRELIRMAAGQLLDYAYVGRKEFGKPHMAILLPRKPNTDDFGWLKEIGIHLIWREGKFFRDNCSGQFT